MPIPPEITIFQDMKKILTIILAITLCTACFAVDIEEVIAKAYENSPKVAQYERSRQDSLLSAGVSDNTWSYTIEVPNSVVFDDEGTHYPSARISSSITNSKNNVLVSGSLSLSKNSLLSRKDSDYHSLSGQFKVAKTFDFSDWSSSDYSREIRDVTVEQSYESSVLKFRKSVITDVYSIIDAQHKLLDSERKLAESQKDYESKLATGELKEGTTAQIKAKMTLDSSISSLDSSRKSLESKLAAFEKEYGFAYIDVDSASRPALEFTSDSENSLSVYLAKLNYLSAQQSLNEKTGKGKSITLSANVDPSLNFRTNTGYDGKSLSLGTGFDYASGNFSVGASLSESYDADGWGTPSLSVKGSYTDGNKNTKEINDLETAVMTKQLAYDTAVFTYETSAKTVADNIQKALVAYDQLEIRKDYNNRILDYTKTLYENGFTTEKALNDALFDVETDRVEELLLNLTALQLECEIEILAL